MDGSLGNLIFLKIFITPISFHQVCIFYTVVLGPEFVEKE